ncbi:MAG TPA: HAD family hydrolase [Acidimicrobiales bacterium]|nr:HAD family hydrolase [Acidimicrobiales bacterium]
MTDSIRRTAVLFDLDGTLIDSVYQHVIAWRTALEAVGIEVAVWTIHRKIGMSGGLFARALLRETGLPITPDMATRLHDAHRDAFRDYAATVRPLPGAVSLLERLTDLGVPWGIATSSHRETAEGSLRMLHVAADVPVITRDRVARAKPDPDLVLAAAADVGVPIEDCVVVGDSVWDLLAARRARALGVGLLSGGYGREELERAGAFRVYEDPADFLRHLDEVGIRDALPEI